MEWIDVSEDLPQLEKNMKNVSQTVKILLSNNEISEGFYAYHHDKWYYSNGNTVPKYKDVIAWSDI